MSSQDLHERLARIEREVEGGNADLSELGFWAVVREVKRDRRLSDRWADAIGRIDRMAFERSVRPRLPVWLGNLVLLLGSAVLVVAVPVAIELGRGTEGAEGLVGAGIDVSQPLWAGLLAVAAAGGLSVTLHDLAHWAVGRAAGMRFLCYFLDGPTRIQPGLKTDYATYLRTPPGARAWMHASGAIASKLAPFAVFAAVYLPHRSAGYDLFPSWSLWAILAFGVIQLITDALFSTKRSDWKKVRRERRVVREQTDDRTLRR